MLQLMVKKFFTLLRSKILFIYTHVNISVSAWHKPIKQSNAQHLVEYEKQLLYKENKKSGKVMQKPMDSYVCGINTRSESILIRLYLLFAR